MRIAILGHGVEGKSVERYFEGKGAEIRVFDEAAGDDFGAIDFSMYDMVFRSPSVPLDKVKGGGLTSATRYFFEKCPAKIIGVTATKGKGTICSMVASIFAAAQRKVWLVGNIGVAALDVLDEIGADDIVIYEMSSFQLWDLDQSPNVAVVGRIEADHLNVHRDMDDYRQAKRNIVRFQGARDVTIYFAGNELSREIGEGSSARKKLMYPTEFGAHVAGGWFWFGGTRICETSVLGLPGEHNVENALAAISVCFGRVDVGDIAEGLAGFEGLPHRLELVRELDEVKYYDDNYSSATPATEVAVKAFDGPIVLILGGYNRGLDYQNFIKFLNGRTNLKKVLLIGEVAGQMSDGLTRDFEIMDGLASAVRRAREVAVAGDTVVMSPGAASFDLFKNFTERAEEFQRMVREL